MSSGLVAVHVASDALIALACALIPIALALFVRRRQDASVRRSAWGVGIFLASCGLAHLMGILTLWHPGHWPEAAIKAFAAVASLTTAVALFPVLRRAVNLPGPADLARAHAELQKVEIRLRASMDGTLDAFCICESVRDNDGKIVDFCIVDVNRAAAMRFVMSPHDLRDAMLSTADDPELASLPMDAVIQAVETGERWEREFELPTSGDIVLQQVIPLGDGFSLIARDVTNQRRQYELLELHSALVRGIREGLCVVRASDLAIVYANSRFEEMLGYGPGELDACSIETFIPPNELRAGQDVVAKLREEGEATYEIENVKKDGTRIQIRGSASTIFHPQHDMVWVAVHEDVTERKRSREVIERLAAIVESTPEAIIGKTLDGTITSWNAGAARLYGYSAAEAVGQPSSMITPEDAAVNDRELLELAARGEPVPPFETVRVAKDGRRIAVMMTASPIRDARGQLVGMSTIAHDVTKRKLAQDALEESLREKEVLLKEVHHRVKNNLQVISSLLKLHAQNITDEDARAAFGDAQDRVRTIALLHEKLYQSKSLGSIDVGEYVHDLTHILLRSYGRTIGKVHLDVQAPGVYLPIHLAVPCGLILNELLTNALKHAFAPPFSGQPEIRIRAWYDGDDVELTLSDNGCGFPPDFDPAQRKTLGMHLVRTLSRQLGGKIVLQTEGSAKWVLRFPFDSRKES